MTNTSFLVDPFAAMYFVHARGAAEALKRAPAHKRVAGYEVVGQIDGPHAIVYVGRNRDGTLVVLKGFHPDTPVTPIWQATRELEALRMITFTSDGFVPIEENISFIPGGATTFLCMPYCEGGSLRDRLAVNDITIAELAYHALVIVCAIKQLHDAGVIHGDIKPANILFAYWTDDFSYRNPGTQVIPRVIPRADCGWHPGSARRDARWLTWLSDLETVTPIGKPTSWRMTPGYAAPEQISGAPADPAMDTWAWGATVRDGLLVTGAPQGSWHWLADLVDRAMSPEPAARPAATEIVDEFGRHIGFGDTDHVYIGAASGDAVSCYPSIAQPLLLDETWQWRENVDLAKMTMGWVDALRECERLYPLNTAAAFLRIERRCSEVLGDPASPVSAWQLLCDDPTAPAVASGGDAAMTIQAPGMASGPVLRFKAVPRWAILSFIKYLTGALASLVEQTGGVDAQTRLQRVAQAWELIDEFDSVTATSVLARAWLILDDPERASEYLARSYAADPLHPYVLETRRQFHIVNGNRAQAVMLAWTALRSKRAEDPAWALGWMMNAAEDLLEAGDYDHLDREILELFPPGKVSIIDLIRCVLAGRRGPVQPDALWLSLREQCAISSTIRVEELRYLLEAAYQRGDLEFVRPRVKVALARPEIKMPLHHQTRAAIEAIALGRNPADRRLTTRLNNRARLWADNGRSDDPLVGLCLVAAERWEANPGRAELSGDTRDLIEHSQRVLANRAALVLYTRYCATCRREHRIEHLSVCGYCHQVFCFECVDFTRPDQTCHCGGNLAHP